MLHISVNFMSSFYFFPQYTLIDAVSIVNLVHLLGAFKQSALQNNQSSLKNTPSNPIFHNKIFHFLWWIKELVRMMNPIVMIDQQWMDNLNCAIRHDDESI